MRIYQQDFKKTSYKMIRDAYRMWCDTEGSGEILLIII